MTVDVVKRTPSARRLEKSRPLVWSAIGRIALYSLLGIIAVVMVMPFVWMVLTSLKSSQDLAASPPTLLPTEWKWSNYAEAMQAAPFVTYARNSLIIAVSHTAINLVIASMAGYALARLKFRGSNLAFMAVLGALMIPTYTKIIPEFLIVRFMPLFGGNDLFGQGGTGWLDTWWALIVPGAVTPFAVFLFRQFYMDLPVELEEAARLDGVSELGIWARIMTPLIKPAFITAGLLTFVDSWNNFLWPLIVTHSDSMRVIQVGLSVFRTENGTQWAYLMAGTTLATAPMVLLFILGQKYFVRGFANAGIK
ncbi:carbohydrate ABC transporter permease [Brooklawnia cerclae]|uniref:Multiple sugar transport system permease protein n=1 Tax=Brooklawnia cerclae TaxID=349934 RepID=A0ABX0SJN4_9ACTN|nr:multiple sugar transport system permease protein [Brooklawnia cerclae]